MPLYENYKGELMITRAEKFRMQYSIDRSLEEIENRREIMKKLFSHEDLTIEELYKLRESIMQSNTSVEMLRVDVDRLAVEKPKARRFRIFK